VEAFLEKIKSKTELEKIYSLGKIVFSRDKKIKANYIYTSRNIQPEFRYAVTISSKSGSSVWRNRFKRLIRESVRSENGLIKEIMFIQKSNLSIVFSPGRLKENTRKKIFLADIKPAITEILQSVKSIKPRETH
jgi:ribonuclease P protein component